MSKTNSPSKGCNKSGVANTDYLKTLGGLPEKQNRDQIDKNTHGRSNGKAPGSVRK
jgi:hypothetical protein